MRWFKVLVVLGSFVGALLNWQARVQAKISPGPPLGLTGAPDEGTCVGCHYTYGGAQGVPNLGPGRVQLSGLPAYYTPGQSYVVTVTVTANDARARRWGFELTALDAQGSSLTVGELTVTDPLRVLKRTASFADRLRLYLSHNDDAGTNLGQALINSWSFQWTAPAASAGEITFYAVGNAADGQVTPEGDYIYTTLAVVKPPVPRVAAQALTALSTYVSSAAAPLELRARGNFSADAKLVFNGVELVSQTVAEGLAATVPANLLSAPGVYSVQVKFGTGELSNVLEFVVATQLSEPAVIAVDAAAYARALAPGQIAALFGTELTQNSQTALAAALPLPRVLQGTAVYLNGVAAPLFFTSNGQINFQVPYRTDIGLASVLVRRADGVVAQGYVNIYPTAPTLFAANATGQGQAAALNADYSPNGDSSADPQAKRATKGSYVSLFGGGTGTQLNDENGQPAQPGDGQAASSKPLFVTATLPTVTIGGRAANVAFSGLVPGLVSLWQLNVQIPPEAPSGRKVEVVVNWGQRYSNLVTLAIE